MAREALGDVAIEAFEAADGVRVEAVVNEKYAQGRQSESRADVGQLPST